MHCARCTIDYYCHMMPYVRTGTHTQPTRIRLCISGQDLGFFFFFGSASIGTLYSCAVYYCCDACRLLLSHRIASQTVSHSKRAAICYTSVFGKISPIQNSAARLEKYDELIRFAYVVWYNSICDMCSSYKCALGFI